MFAKITSCLNLQLLIVILKKSIISDMRQSTCNTSVKVHVNYFFSKLRLVDQSKPCTLIYLQKMASCINLQLPIVILKKSIYLDMHHHKTYMYVNFQQNRVSRLVQTVQTNLFAKSCKLHKLVTCN